MEHLQESAVWSFTDICRKENAVWRFITDICSARGDSPTREHSPTREQLPPRAKDSRSNSPMESLHCLSNDPRMIGVLIVKSVIIKKRGDDLRND